MDESTAETHREKEHVHGVLVYEAETTNETTDHTSQIGESRPQVEGEQDMEVQLVPDDGEKQTEGRSDTEHQITAEGKSD